MGLAEFIVLFRESLEVAFVVGIILAYLHKTKNEEYEKHVWLGVASGVILSIIAAYLFQFSSDLFEKSEALFEGVFMVVTALLVTWLIVWILKQQKVVESIQLDVKKRVEQGSPFGLFILTTVAVLREGVEAVLFLSGIFLNTGALSIVGAFLGIVAAVIIGILVFEYAMRFNISLFFKATAIVLILLAAGLFSQGVHELQEAGVLPVFIEHVYDINPPKLPDGSYPIMHEKGAIGSVLKGLVGYDGNPSDLQVLGYLGYLAGAYWFYKSS